MSAQLFMVLRRTAGASVAIPAAAALYARRCPQVSRREAQRILQQVALGATAAGECMIEGSTTIVTERFEAYGFTAAFGSSPEEMLRIAAGASDEDDVAVVNAA